MYINQRKEQFSFAYVHAMAAQAGLNLLSRQVDDDSVDITYTATGYKGKIRNPQLDIQLKCHGINQKKIIEKDFISYKLKLKNYNDLRGYNVLSPRYLVVLFIPENTDDWTEHSNDSLILRHSCYWVSIRDYPETKNTTSVSIKIPLSQELTCKSLKHLMECASKEEWL